MNLFDVRCIKKKIPTEKIFLNIGFGIFFLLLTKERKKRTYYTITWDNVFLSIICIIEVFEMMATLAIGGLDSTKLQDVKRKRERERMRVRKRERKNEKKRNEDKYFKKEREREKGKGKGEIRSSRKCAEPYESSKGQILRGELH